MMVTYLYKNLFNRNDLLLKIFDNLNFYILHNILSNKMINLFTSIATIPLLLRFTTSYIRRNIFAREK